MVLIGQRVGLGGKLQHNEHDIIAVVVDIRVDMLAALLKEHQELVYRYIVSSGKFCRHSFLVSQEAMG